MKGFLHSNQIVPVLQGFNPWWNVTPTSTPAFHRVAFQICRKYLDDPELKRAILLSGPRRVGM